jgi:molybdate transport repressor ModE-like protein
MEAVGEDVRGTTEDLRTSVFDARIELRQLGVLLAIGQTGSLAAAARKLGVSQPTIAHHLDVLESIIGTALVRRGPRGAVLTDVGRVVSPQAEAIMDRLSSALTEARGLARAGVATLRVGTFSSAGGVLLPAAIGEVRRQTDVRVELREAETIDLLADLAADALHVALVYNDSTEPLAIPEGWTASTLGWDRYLLAIPADHPHRGPVIDVADCAADGWILSRLEDPAADRDLLVAAARAGFTPRPVLRTDDFHVALGFVAAGLGVAVIPQLAVESRPGVRFVEIQDANLGRTLGVVHPVDMTFAVRVLVDRLIADAPTVLSSAALS